jgi:beta-glucosidase-like glycosyl hydrolase
MIRLGSNVPPPTSAEADEARVAEILTECPVGGLIVFRGTWPDLRGTLDRLQAISPIPLLVASDLERGLGQQVRGATRFPHAMALGHAPDSDDAVASLARITAQEARAAGIHLAFAPVVDVHLHEENPIIGPRAFASTPERVARCAETYIRTANAEGMLTCAKHFPGHGRTVTDSHDRLPVVDLPEDRLRESDLLPFRRAIEAGVDTVMTAHVAYPSLDASGRPATASAPILGDLLRDEMGFSGCVVSDSLLMEGIRDDAAGPGARAAALVEAGVDLLLDPQEPRAVIDGLVDAVESGQLSEVRFHDAFERVWRLKMQMLAADGQEGCPSSVEQVGCDAHWETALDVAARGAKMQRDLGETLWSRRGDGVVLVRFERGTTPDVQPMETLLAEVLPAAELHVLHPDVPADQRSDAERAAQDAKLLVCIVAAEPAAWQSFGLPPELETMAAAMLERRGAAPRRATLLAVLGSPTTGDRVETRVSAGGQLARVDFFSDETVSRKALLRGLARRIGSGPLEQGATEAKDAEW